MTTRRTIRIMIVDDSDLIREGLKAIFDRFEQSFEIVADVADAYEALDRIRVVHPEVVLMDLRMPGMDGINATREIKSLFPGIKILIYSGSYSHEDVLNALAAGANGYCLKEQNHEFLINAIDAVSQGVGWIDPQLTTTVFHHLTKIRQRNLELLEQKSLQPTLSSRELEVLMLLSQGKSNVEIGCILSISPETVKSHVRNLTKKLEACGRTQAAVKALQFGLLH